MYDLQMSSALPYFYVYCSAQVILFSLKKCNKPKNTFQFLCFFYLFLNFILFKQQNITYLNKYHRKMFVYLVVSIRVYLSFEYLNSSLTITSVLYWFLMILTSLRCYQDLRSLRKKRWIIGETRTGSKASDNHQWEDNIKLVDYLSIGPTKEAFSLIN